MFKSLFSAALLALLCVSAAHAAKTDVVVLSNGDRVTGEIKKLEAGLLEFSTDTMGTVNIEWRFIEQLYSATNQNVELTNGSRWVGTLELPEGSESLILDTGQGPIHLNLDEVVSVWPVKAAFWDKADLTVSAGLDFASSTNITNLNIASDFLYRTSERVTDISSRSYITRQSEGDDQRRHELRGSHQYLLPDMRFRVYLASLETNDALGINLRANLGLGLGKYLSKTNNNWLSLVGGLMLSRENPAGSPSEDNIEAIGNLRHRYFYYAHPKRTFDTSLSVFPSVTDFGRLRADLRSTFRLELISDLYWSMELYANYDNEPLSEGAEKYDYGLTSALSYKF